jgi:hypothetical protein
MDPEMHSFLSKYSSTVVLALHAIWYRVAQDELS